MAVDHFNKGSKLAYNSLIPQATDKPKDSQSQLLANFGGIKTLVDINHVTFDDPDEGKHKFVTFPRQGAAPATAATDFAVYSKLSTLGALETELFVRRQNSGTEYEFTSSLQTNDGWTRLPSGILIKWGRSSGSGLATYTWPVAATIPVFSTCFNVQVSTEDGTIGDGNKMATLRVFTALDVSLYCGQRTVASSPTSVTYTVFAVGV